MPEKSISAGSRLLTFSLVFKSVLSALINKLKLNAMKSALKFMVLCLAASSVLQGCSKDEGPDLIDTNNPNEIGPALLFPSGSTQVNGTPPSPTGTPESPGVGTVVNTITSSNGGTVPLGFDYNNVNGNLGGCYVVVEGYEGVYWNVPYGSNSGESGSLQLPIGIPTDADEGTFCIDFCVYDQQNRVSNIINVCVDVLRLGTGGLQISLSWGTATDQDIYVTTPDGSIISYTNTTAQGGELDRDDTDGFGPENVFWVNDAPDGTYSVSVNDYTGTTTANPFYITINAPGITRNYSGSTQNGSTANVVTFSKSGDNFNF